VDVRTGFDRLRRIGGREACLQPVEFGAILAAGLFAAHSQDSRSIRGSSFGTGVRVEPWRPIRAKKT
jgi:hypothetical protein